MWEWWTYNAFRRSQVNGNNFSRLWCTHHALHCAQWHQLEQWKQRRLQWQATDVSERRMRPMQRKHQLPLVLMWRHLTSGRYFIFSRKLAACSLILWCPAPNPQGNCRAVSFCPPHCNVQQRSYVEPLLPHSVGLSRGDTMLQGFWSCFIQNWLIWSQNSYHANSRFLLFSLWPSVYTHSCCAVCILCWFSPRYLVAAKQHLSPEQLFFPSTTTYWVTQSAQPSLAIPLGVPGVHAKSLQLSLPYLLLMSALRYTNPCHYQSPLPHTFKPGLFFSLLCDS